MPRPLAGNSTVINAKDRKNKETSWEQFSPCENIRLVSISAKLVLHDPSQPKILEKLINNKLYSPTILLPKMKEKWFLYHNKSPIKSHIYLNESVIFNNTKRQRFSLRQGKTDNKNGKLVLQYCSKTSWVATLRVLNTYHESNQPRSQVLSPTRTEG